MVFSFLSSHIAEKTEGKKELALRRVKKEARRGVEEELEALKQVEAGKESNDDVVDFSDVKALLSRKAEELVASNPGDEQRLETLSGLIPDRINQSELEKKNLEVDLEYGMSETVAGYEYERDNRMLDGNFKRVMRGILAELKSKKTYEREADVYDLLKENGGYSAEELRAIGKFIRMAVRLEDIQEILGREKCSLTDDQKKTVLFIFARGKGTDWKISPVALEKAMNLTSIEKKGKGSVLQTASLAGLLFAFGCAGGSGYYQEKMLNPSADQLWTEEQFRQNRESQKQGERVSVETPMVEIDGGRAEYKTGLQQYLLNFSKPSDAADLSSKVLHSRISKETAHCMESGTLIALDYCAQNKINISFPYKDKSGKIGTLSLKSVDWDIDRFIRILGPNTAAADWFNFSGNESFQRIAKFVKGQKAENLKPGDIVVKKYIDENGKIAFHVYQVITPEGKKDPRNRGFTYFRKDERGELKANVLSFYRDNKGNNYLAFGEANKLEKAGNSEEARKAVSQTYLVYGSLDLNNSASFSSLKIQKVSNKTDKNGNPVGEGEMFNFGDVFEEGANITFEGTYFKNDLIKMDKTNEEAKALRAQFNNSYPEYSKIAGKELAKRFPGGLGVKPSIKARPDDLDSERVVFRIGDKVYKAN